MAPGTFTIAFPLGVTVGKWTRVFEERHPDVDLSVVRERPDELRVRLDLGEVDLAFVRLPLDTEGLHVIPLYAENVVAAMNHEHVLTLEKKLHMADLDGETIIDPGAGEEWDETFMRRVAAGDGIGVVPQSVAKALRRRDVVALPLEDADPAEVALAWPRESENAWVDEFIGIVRGRTAHSSRNPEVAAAEAADARQKDAAKGRTGDKPRTGVRSGSKSSRGGKGAPRKGRR
ncbi:LysR family transcriptional regulator substrate-binding protein [Diaminobutyricibacter tongyongensis]|uniref:LysR family transcriptional regulator substrate-binding protein n=1 Tax=Leifsonia tongyongensis TaxID=1268043 RepID=A0A6L9Y1L8_9MICO|nr:LysR family transcriptional regulator substrate-binding protein [Diaminobutyricibacter tongyongensis]NEN07466.1 LysR family transcriptional regulator substrate-binding protein [Diaminobutyricibacter tongyongensis]